MQRSSQTELIQVKSLNLSFGGVLALNKIDLDIFEGELLALIGPNGAGKTCLLNCINGFYNPDAGHIEYKGKDITAMPLIDFMFCPP